MSTLLVSVLGKRGGRSYTEGSDKGGGAMLVGTEEQVLPA